MPEPPVVALQIQQKKGHGEFARMHLRRLALPPTGLVPLGHTEQQHWDNLLEAAGAALRTVPWKPGLCPGAPGQPASSLPFCPTAYTGGHEPEHPERAHFSTFPQLPSKCGFFQMSVLFQQNSDDKEFFPHFRQEERMCLWR